MVDHVTVGIFTSGATQKFSRRHLGEKVPMSSHFIGSEPTASREVGNRKSRIVKPVIVGSTGWKKAGLSFSWPQRLTDRHHVDLPCCERSLVQFSGCTYRLLSMADCLNWTEKLRHVQPLLRLVKVFPTSAAVPTVRKGGNSRVEKPDLRMWSLPGHRGSPLSYSPAD